VKTRVRGGPRWAVVSRFPPIHCGIAQYAEQFANDKAREHVVLRIGLPGSSADRSVRLDGRLRPLRILRTTRSNDQVVLMWHPQFFISGRVWNRALAYLALGVVFRLRKVEIVFHQHDYAVNPKPGGFRGLPRRLVQIAQNWCWSSGALHTFHTEHERTHFEQQFPRHSGTRCATLTPAGAHYRPYVDVTRIEARRGLGLEPEACIFLCIGFLEHHKGFDRAVRAMARLGGAAKLFIIGSCQREIPEIRSYAQELAGLARSFPSVHISERFISDVEFDQWLLAADAVLAPYRFASSSGVVARAKLLGTTVVAAPVGGIPEQLSNGDIVVNSDDELAKALLDLATKRQAEGRKPAALDPLAEVAT
jgi:glycosyltransferase involved in cell wall biosynthesis